MDRGGVTVVVEERRIAPLAERHSVAADSPPPPGLIQTQSGVLALYLDRGNAWIRRDK